ncbi:SfnB family sulfur acquisition oxidoreductase [uncultured Acinetobacter sp.]|nr:SfnB family sulfur acquisition oxidoreductase [uncultured Acinetobacter sp.]
MISNKGINMSESSSLSKRSVHILKNDQQALNAAYQVADEALVNRNIRDQQRILPYEAIEHLSQKGLGGIRIPKRYGGAFVSNKTLAQVFRILSKADSNVGQIPQNQISLLNLIDLMGNEEQKKRVFGEILAGKRLANGGPERQSKDSKTVHTTLIQNGEVWVLNGEKFYSTGSIFADWLAIKALHPEGHVVLVLVDRFTNGIEIEDDWNGFGQRTTASGTIKLNQVHIDPALIFDERLLTQAPNYRGAYSQLMQVAIDVGIAEAAFTDLISAVKKARPVIDANVEKASLEHFTIQETGKLQVLLDAAIALLDDAAEYLDELDSQFEVTDAQAARASILVAEAKVYANDAALTISEKLLELGGSRASLSQHNLDQHWRNARVHTLHDPVRWKIHAIGNYYLNGVFPARHAWI